MAAGVRGAGLTAAASGARPMPSRRRGTVALLLPFVGKAFHVASPCLKRAADPVDPRIYGSA